ncbi:hypothetical protein VD0004_g8804 [Verticillium dahliae]|uniref:Mitochondrial metalloendopeptidase OMA1 n=3 Tax=Verticillium dahliae TaxID=27337 RepID=G2WRG9_VERDV|nr:mitochondrial metalloendopeptidase OMA1 [Verticillium dahliae VdLs.17]KAH6709921.1 mitochondrial metalloendopeptidase OMA1 [Verticillium dahliae]EGY13470.1 mitochondrial metalloendopeptidase OMA1 [Verticillium dahliae VdLs.17]PNH34401.1 hypothetical protein BJF96_g2705 [Verticillium dahliae]PNH38003.1 hypothetical protein VD0004_g8804 [Verticillium dahliae]PNH47901.1 hypothetical protein VD0003_g8729 [Verticillium dahliae]
MSAYRACRPLAPILRTPGPVPRCVPRPRYPPTQATLTAARRLFSHGPRRPWLHNDAHDRLRSARPIFTADNVRRTVRSPRTHTVVVVAVLAAGGFYFSNLQTVPVSGRRRFNCFADETVAELSAQQVRQIELEVERQGGRFLPAWDPRTRLVERVMARLIPVSGGGALPRDEHDGAGPAPHDTWWGGGQEGDGDKSSSSSSSSSGGGSKVDWEIRVIDDPNTMNAFVLPGGKVFVHSGILRATRTEAGLAAVLGHEIAHNMASHVGERMSGSIGINILLYSFYALSYAIPGGIFLIHSLGGGLLDMVFSMPMSRMQESEADYIGLMLMAEACYDPREAVGFWQRMEAASRSQGEEVPELMSTHPSNQHRIEKIQSWLPQALEKFQISDCQGTSAFADAFRRALERGTQFQTIYM